MPTFSLFILQFYIMHKGIARKTQMWDNFYIKEKDLIRKHMTIHKNNLGDQFRHAVQDAINKGDFSKLNYLVTDTVSDAIAEASVQFQKITNDVQREFQSSTARPAPRKKPILPIAKTKNVGSVSSILYIVFGSIGTTVNTLAVLGGTLGMFLLADFTALPVFAFLTILAAGFSAMLAKGVTQSQRLERMKRYIKLCDDNMYINISDLAQQTHKSIPYVRKDVKKMIQLGHFPEGHLDDKETCLMLDDGTYREYLRVEEERKAYVAEENTPTAANVEATPNNDLQSMIVEGQGYITKLHYLNDIIEDEVVSEKLYHMEDLLKEIFRRLKESPNQMPKMRKLMNYYLPTTINLLQAYSEFDDVSVPNQDIISAKSEIEKTIDIINEAFAELLNKLFQESAFNASTDAQVLQTMLAKEGLTKTSMTEEK